MLKKCRLTHQVAVRVRRLEWVTSELSNQLRDGEFVRFTNMIEQTEGMILDIHTDRQTDIQTDRQTYRQTDRHTYDGHLVV